MGRDDDDACDGPNPWAYAAPQLDADGERLTLALLEDLSRLLVVHGYPPLRGQALADVALTLQRLQHWPG